jgi:uncharacterized phage protein gp47/JayE
VVDDGTGAPSSGTLEAVTTSIDAARACGIQFSVFAPSVTTANVSVLIGIADGYSGDATRTAVQTAISTYISGLAMGESLLWSRLLSIIYGASDGVSSVTNLLINGAAPDITATGQ